MAAATVQEIIPYLRELVFVESSASIERVRSVMVLNEISRVPVIDGDRRSVRGIVRLKSFFRRSVLGIEPQELSEVLDRSPLPVVDADTPLFEAVEKLRGANEVLVRGGADGKHTHMLTPRGLANWVVAYARPFLVIEELETALRECLVPFAGERLEAITKTKVVERLNPIDYQNACTAFRTEIPALCRIDEGELNTLLVRFAERRNELMHFRVASRASIEPDLHRFALLKKWLAEARPAT